LKVRTRTAIFKHLKTNLKICHTEVKAEIMLIDKKTALFALSNASEKVSASSLSRESPSITEK
jgi:hypothetical protein